MSFIPSTGSFISERFWEDLLVEPYKARQLGSVVSPFYRPPVASTLIKPAGRFFRKQIRSPWSSLKDEAYVLEGFSLNCDLEQVPEVV